jgi:hypothetical protein
MKILKILLYLSSLTLLSITVKAATFCACCAEPGEYYIRVQKPGEFELRILEQLEFQTADMYTNAASPENILGITSLADTFSIKSLFQKKAWKITLTDDQGKSGTLSLPVSATMVSFGADLHDYEPGSAGPILYKEWRFKSRVAQGTGIFQKGIIPTPEYFLVLQGRGNNCADSTDFKHWRLEITGKKASYAFYGKIKQTE